MGAGGSRAESVRGTVLLRSWWGRRSCGRSRRDLGRGWRRRSGTSFPPYPRAYLRSSGFPPCRISFRCGATPPVAGRGAVETWGTPGTVARVAQWRPCRNCTRGMVGMGLGDRQTRRPSRSAQRGRQGGCRGNGHRARWVGEGKLVSNAEETGSGGDVAQSGVAAWEGCLCR